MSSSPISTPVTSVCLMKLVLNFEVASVWFWMKVSRLVP